MTTNFSNSSEVIDSRDVIERIEELTDLRTAWQEDHNLADYAGDSLEEWAEWNESEDGEELQALEKLAEEAEGYAEDWKYGETLIRDSHFEDYARQLAEDCGMVPDGLKWPLSCIDWEEAADELKMDYTSIDYDGVTYWIR